MNEFVKLLVCCYRPWIRDPRVVPAAEGVSGASGYSFPSGHTTRSSALFGSLAYMFRKHRVVLVACVAVVVLVGFSRNFLGYHTPQDVLVGLCIGLGSVLLASRLLPWIAAGKNRDAKALAVVLALSAVVLVVISVKPYPLDYDASGALLVDPVRMMRDCCAATGAFDGVAVGIFLERRFVRFRGTPSLAWKAVRFAPAAALVPLSNMLYAPVAALTGIHVSMYAVSGLMMLVLLFAWPWVFWKAERKGLARTATC